MPTKFEAWKQEMTLEGEAERRQTEPDGIVCYDCPAKKYCDESRRNKNKECGEIFTDWGNQDAEQ